MKVFFAVSYGTWNTRFVLRAENNADAISLARNHAKGLGAQFVFVEDMKGCQLYDGQV